MTGHDEILVVSVCGVDILNRQLIEAKLAKAFPGKMVVFEEREALPSYDIGFKHLPDAITPPFSPQESKARRRGQRKNKWARKL